MSTRLEVIRFGRVAEFGNVRGPAGRQLFAQDVHGADVVDGGRMRFRIAESVR